MDPSPLTPEQIQAAENRVAPALEYLGELAERMTHRGLEQDRLFERIADAQAALQALLAELRASGVPAGSGRSARSRKRAR